MENTIKAVCDNVPTTYQGIIISRLRSAKNYASLYAENRKEWDRAWYSEAKAFVDGILFVLGVQGLITQEGKNEIYDAICDEINNIFYGTLK